MMVIRKKRYLILCTTKIRQFSTTNGDHLWSKLWKCRQFQLFPAILNQLNVRKVIGSSPISSTKALKVKVFGTLEVIVKIPGVVVTPGISFS